MKKRFVVAELLLRGGLFAAMARGRRCRRRLAVVNYHRLVANSGAEPRFDPDQYGPTEGQFSNQLKWLKRYSTVLSMAELEAIVAGERDWPLGLCSLVSFDDGYRDNLQIALPQLMRRQVPATFFLVTGFLDRTSHGWWEDVAWVVAKATPGEYTLEGKTFQLPTEAREARRHVLACYKSTAAQEAPEIIESLRRTLEVTGPDPAVHHRELMDWEDARRVVEEGMAIGAHSASHPVLSRCSKERQRFEIEEPRQRLALGPPVNAFAYPVGAESHFDGFTESAVRSAGYRLAFSFNTGVQDKARLQPFSIRRVNPYHSVATLAAALVLPKLVVY